jgi:hypothetical protein
MSRLQLALAVLCMYRISVSVLDGQATDPNAAPKKPPVAESEAAPRSNGKVLFSRSSDESGVHEKDTAQTASPPYEDTLQPTPDERDSLTFLDYDLDIRLTPNQHALAVRARMTVRNDGERPLKRIALQLSSDLKWERIRSGASDLVYTQHLVDDDADHSGAVREALVVLPRELAPKEELRLEAFYSGSIPLTAARLERIGAPTESADHSDWDRIAPEFTGLRGFGDVVWYPVSAPPRLLGDGATLFAEIGRQKLRQEHARVAMTVVSEFPDQPGAPNLAVLDGHVVPVIVTAAPENSYPGVVTATLPPSTLGFAAPSLFLLVRRQIQSTQTVDTTATRVFAGPDDLVNAQAFWPALNKVAPLVQEWLGPKPKTPLAIIALPDPGDTPAEEGSALFTGFQASPASGAVESAMVHSLAHAYFSSPRVWLQEGVPELMSSLWIEQTQGRQAALEALGSARGALALAEPATPGESGGESLLQATQAVRYRIKAAYVLWMLRDLAGDQALASALRAYVGADDTSPDYFERLVEKAVGPEPKDLKWFFDSWVYHDRGLPDLSIGGVFPAKAATEGQWLVALDLANDGYAEAEVPVTLRSKGATVTERLRVPPRGEVSRRMIIQGTPTEVQVNDGTVPETRESVHLQTLTPITP